MRIGVVAEQVVLARVKERVRPSFQRNLMFVTHMVVGFIFFVIGLTYIQMVKFSRKAKMIFSKISSHVDQVSNRVAKSFFHKKTLAIAA